MKVAIVGSREIKDYSILEEAVKKSNFKITEVVSGGAKGVDSLAEEFANNNNIECTVFKPDWNNINAPNAIVKTNEYGKQYNVLAGFERNTKIVEYCDAMIAIDNGSNGTGDSIKKMQATGKPLYVHSLISESTHDEVYAF